MEPIIMVQMNLFAVGRNRDSDIDNRQKEEEGKIIEKVALKYTYCHV